MEIKTRNGNWFEITVGVVGSSVHEYLWTIEEAKELRIDLENALDNISKFIEDKESDIEFKKIHKGLKGE